MQMLRISKKQNVSWDKILKYLLATGVFFLFLPEMASSSVVINEIAWMGSKIEKTDSKNWWRYEWIEIFNSSNIEININGWKIESKSAKSETIIIPEGKIPSQGFFLICKTEMLGCNLKTSKLSLINDYKQNGKLILKDSQNNLIDQTPEPSASTWPAGNNATKQTMEKNNNGWQTSLEINGTPGKINSARETSNNIESFDYIQKEPTANNERETASIASSSPTAEPNPIQNQIEYPKNIFINEVLPSPQGSDAENEWIEIYNNNNFEVTLTNWQIKDKIGAIKTYNFPNGTKIPNKGFLVISREKSNLALQNSGDGLWLLNPNKKIAHLLEYPKASQGQSYNKTANGWVWSTTPTPNKPNIITQPETKTATPTKQNKFSTTTSIAIQKAKILADIEKSNRKPQNKTLIFLIALIIATISSVAVLIIKNKTKARYFT